MFKIFIIKRNLAKNLIKKEALLIIETNFKSEIKTINTIVYYVENKIKFNNITYCIKFEDKKD